MQVFKTLLLKIKWSVKLYFMRSFLEKRFAFLWFWRTRPVVKFVVPKVSDPELKRREFCYHLYTVVYGHNNHATMMHAIPVLASLTPSRYKVVIEDENIGPVQFDDSADIVAITATTSLADRAYEIADGFRAKGVTVIMGGIHASIFPDEALEHADSVVIGEAELQWKNVLNDYQNHALQKKYITKDLPQLNEQPLPRYDLIDNKRYNFHSVQTIRGCPNECGYCSVPRFCGRQYRSKSVDRVIQEMQLVRAIQNKTLYICDDNFTVDVTRVKKLLRRMIPLKLNYAIQTRLEIANDVELLELLHDSGCINIVIGLESVNQENLKIMKKSYDVEWYCEAIQKIQEHGLLVSGSFMFGQDADDVTIFKKTADFINMSRMGHSIINIVTPLPGTAFYESIEREGRLVHKNWALYDLKNVCFQPKNMSQEALANGFRWAYQNVFELNRVYTRVMDLYAVWNRGGYRKDRRDFPLMQNLVSHDIAYAYPLATCPE